MWFVVRDCFLFTIIQRDRMQTSALPTITARHSSVVTVATNGSAELLKLADIVTVGIEPVIIDVLVGIVDS